MVVSVPSSTAEASVILPPNSLPIGTMTLWVRGRDTAGNWGSAAALWVVVNAQERTDVEAMPLATYVAAASPNPFRGTTSIRFGLVHPGDVGLELFDVRGRRVRTLVSGPLPSGNHFATWDGRDDMGVPAPSGVFFVRLTSAAGTHVTRLVRLQ
jgi:hypothetical protein